MHDEGAGARVAVQRLRVRRGARVREVVTASRFSCIHLREKETCWTGVFQGPVMRSSSGLSAA